MSVGVMHPVFRYERHVLSGSASATGSLVPMKGNPLYGGVEKVNSYQ
jgi:hypothetical protein